jgi:hypothetical protein
MLRMPFEVNGTIQLIGSSIGKISQTQEESVSVTMELMYILNRSGFKIFEIPVNYNEKNHKSRVRPIKDPWITMLLLFKLLKSNKKN